MKVDPVALSELIKHISELEISFDPTYQYLSQEQRNNSVLYSISSSFAELSAIDIKLLGIPIMAKKRDRIILLPGILLAITNFKTAKFSFIKLIELTKGRSVHTNKRDGQYLAIDQFNRVFALGIVLNQKFNPIIDLGWYLRNDDFYESIL